jgi:hypothetical protein
MMRSEPEKFRYELSGPCGNLLPFPPERLDAPPGRAYTSDMTTQRPGFEPDQIAQAVSVGLCLVLAAVLVVLALV